MSRSRENNAALVFGASPAGTKLGVCIAFVVVAGYAVMLLLPDSPPRCRPSRSSRAARSREFLHQCVCFLRCPILLHPG